LSFCRPTDNLIVPDLEHVLMLELVGTSFVIHADDERWIDLLQSLWDPFCTSHLRDGAVSASITSRDGQWKFEMSPEEPIFCSEPWVFANQVRHYIVERALLLSSDVIGLHAAVLNRRKTAALLVGESGTGKTAISMHLLQRGWSLLSDDLAPVSLETGLIDPFPKPLGVKGKDRVARVRHLWKPPQWLPDPEGICLLPAAIYPTPPTGAVKPKYLIFVERRDGADGTLRGLSPAQAAARCAQYFRRFDARIFALLAGWCRESFAAELSYESSEDAAASVDRWVAAEFDKA
jgi:hypothetical protein